MKFSSALAFLGMFAVAVVAQDSDSCDPQNDNNVDATCSGSMMSSTMMSSTGTYSSMMPTASNNDDDDDDSDDSTSTGTTPNFAPMATPFVYGAGMAAAALGYAAM